MSEEELKAAVRRYVEDCGYSWPTVCDVLTRMTGRQWTPDMARRLYQSR